jgi:nucleoid DNA-binding protein
MNSGDLIDAIADAARITHHKAEQAAKAAVQGFLGAGHAKELAIVPRRPPPEEKTFEMAFLARPRTPREIVPYIAREAEISIEAARTALSVVAASFTQVAAEADAASDR